MDVTVKAEQLVLLQAKALRDLEVERVPNSTGPYVKSGLSAGEIQFKSAILGATRTLGRILRPRRHRRHLPRHNEHGEAHLDGVGGTRTLGRRLRNVERLRCPAGTANGGRFSGAGLAGCGPRVTSRKKNRDGRKLRSRRSNLVTDRGDGNAILVRGVGDTTRAVQISRNARPKK